MRLQSASLARKVSLKNAKRIAHKQAQERQSSQKDEAAREEVYKRIEARALNKEAQELVEKKPEKYGAESKLEEVLNNIEEAKGEGETSCCVVLLHWGSGMHCYLYRGAPYWDILVATKAAELLVKRFKLKEHDYKTSIKREESKNEGVHTIHVKLYIEW